MKKQDCFLLGTIFKLHGYKGYVNIYNDNDIKLIFSKISFFLIEENNELIPYFTENVRVKKKKILLVKFEDINSESEALKILNKKVYLPNTFYHKIQNLNQNQIVVGFNVIDKSLGNIGIVEFVSDSKLQSLILVKNEEKEFHIPFHEKFIKKIDVDNKILKVKIPEELININ